MVREEVNEIVINVSATEIKDSSDVTMLGHMVEESKNNSDAAMLVHMVEGSKNNSDEDKAVERNPEEERREEEEYLVEDVKPNIVKEESGVFDALKQEVSSDDEDDYKALLRAKEEVERLEQKLGAKSGGRFKLEVVKTELDIGDILEVEILEVKVMEGKAKTEEKKKEEEECDEGEVLICFLYFILFYFHLFYFVLF